MRTPLLGLSVLTLVACGGKSTTDDSSTTSVGTPTGTTTTSAGYTFATEDPSAYARIDRVGMPAVATAVISSKDAYNDADPVDDIAGTFVTEIADTLTAIHQALDDDLTGAGLVPCAVDDCLAQAGPLVIPDTLKIDTTLPAGFPNGRLLADPVIDITLAVVLLDLSAPGQDPAALVGALNPTANDIPFPGVWPWLAEPL